MASRLPSKGTPATVPGMLNWFRDRFHRGPVVPVVRLSGVIASGGLLGGRSLSMESVAPLLKRAFETRGAKAVALSLNSPGGSPVQSALIAQRIRLHAAEKGLPVIGPRRRLLSRFGLQTGIGGGIDNIGPATLAALEERALWQRFGL